MNYFPIFLNATYINAMVVGGGEVAARKIELLLKATNNITVMSAKVNTSVERLIHSHQLTWLKHPYQTGLLSNCNLVIAATDDTSVNQAIANESQSLNLLTNVVDQPNLCNYITPAIIDRDPMLIALSSSGSAPILLRMLREQIEKSLPDGYGKLADFSYKFRDHVKARVKNIRDRRTFWENTLRGPIGKHILNGNTIKAEQLLIASLNEKITPPSGEIVFIYTQDGDPDNLTLKAHREIQFAEAIFYDENINPHLLEYCRRDASKYPQDIPANIMINIQHALELAEKGEKVIYLLSGNDKIPDNSRLANSDILTKHIYSGH